MKSPYKGFIAAACGLPLFLAGAPVFAGSVLEVTGSGTMETNCLAALGAGCTLTASGATAGTNVDGGSFVLRIDTGSPASTNGSPVSTPQGVCVPGSFVGRITTAGGDWIEFNHSGVVCEEAAPGSAVHYNAAFRVTAGTGPFAGARGAGTLSAAFTRSTVDQAGTALVYLRGSIE
jgi:hypothetical protein